MNEYTVQPDMVQPTFFRKIYLDLGQFVRFIAKI